MHVHTNKLNNFTFKFHEISFSPSVGHLFNKHTKMKTSQSQLFLQHPSKNKLLLTIII